MPEEPKKDGKKQLEQEVWVAIAAFEQILEAMPGDISSLETLAHAYEQIGDHARAKDYLIRLGDALLREGDHNSARQLLEKLGPYAKDDPRARDLVSRIEKADAPRQGARAAASGSVAAPMRDKRLRAGFNIQDELSFAWSLLEAKELSQEDYAGVVHDLTEMSTSDSATTISVLHTLEFRAAKNLERIMNFASRQCASPVVALGSFGYSVEAMTLVPMDFMVRRGVMCFGFIGLEALVVIMNPHNKALRAEVELMTGRRCHFFLTLPSEFDAALTRVKAQLDGKAAAAAAGH